MTAGWRCGRTVSDHELGSIHNIPHRTVQCTNARHATPVQGKRPGGSLRTSGRKTKPFTHNFCEITDWALVCDGFARCALTVKERVGLPLDL